LNWNGFLKDVGKYFIMFSALTFVVSFIQGIYFGLSEKHAPISAVNGVLDFLASYLGITPESLSTMDSTAFAEAATVTSVFIAIILGLSVLVAWGEYRMHLGINSK
jgi:hypothetical protein